MRRREPVPSVTDLPGPAHDRHRPDLPRSSATRARRPPTVLVHHRRSSPSSNRLAVAPASCRTPLHPPSRRTPWRRLSLAVLDRPVGGVVRHRPPPCRSFPEDLQASPAGRAHREPGRHLAMEPWPGTRSAALPRAPGLALVRRPSRELVPPVRSGTSGPVPSGRSRGRTRRSLPSVPLLFGRVVLSVPQHCLKDPTTAASRGYAASSSRMSSAASSPPPSPSPSKTDPKSSALRALRAMTFSSIVSLATIR